MILDDLNTYYIHELLDYNIDITRGLQWRFGVLLFQYCFEFVFPFGLEIRMSNMSIILIKIALPKAVIDVSKSNNLSNIVI